MLDLKKYNPLASVNHHTIKMQSIGCDFLLPVIYWWAYLEQEVHDKHFRKETEVVLLHHVVSVAHVSPAPVISSYFDRHMAR